MNHRVWKFVGPLVIVIGGFGLAGLLIATGPKVEPRPAQISAPLVRVQKIAPRTVTLRVATYGTVVPRTESELVPEVSGRVLEVSPSLVSGGFFSLGDVLLRIDPLDAEVALERGRASLARAESDMADARKDHGRQRDLARSQATSDAQRDDAENRLRVTQATLREARAELSRAERDVERTEVIAPYDGRVRSERVDVGQFVNRGSAIATIYAVDFAEVRLPIHDAELAYLDLPLLYNDAGLRAGLPVILRARFAGAVHEWQGEVVRTEGELDPRTRMVTVVARVKDPYARMNGRPPLSVGLFVEAEILGAEFEDVVVLPRSALRGGDRVFVVDAQDRLRFREVDVLRLSRDEVYVKAGLERGERVCVSLLEGAVDGMAVRTSDVPQTADGSADPAARSSEVRALEARSPEARS
jgi:RND family efflux transporter MFP subunit